MPSHVNDPRRVTARVALTILVFGLVVAVLFSGGPPLGSTVFAQQTTTSAFRIEFVNPDDGTNNEISGKDDDPGAGTDDTYHLVAWVNQVPTSASVVFQYQSGTSTPVNIGTATQVGTDTFEFFWDSSNFPADNTQAPNSTYTLIAILSSSGQEVARDTETVKVNNASPAAPVPVEDQAQTVEIVDPTNGDVLGFYDPPGEDLPAASIQVRFSEGTERLTAYYTITPPGDDPVWTACGTESAGSAEDGIRCTLDEDDAVAAVTAVAVVTDDGPDTDVPEEDSSDAHRVTAYDADPSSVIIDPPTVSNQAVDTCTPVITATLTDQNGNAVPGADFDVHALGPDSSLAFDDNDSSGNSTSGSQAPQNHATEQARNCEAAMGTPGNSGSQGFHSDAMQSRKHIEASAGTEDDGTFTFRLFSATVGGTQFTAWADEDGNERFCSAEANGSGAVGWGQGAPAVTGVAAEESTCPRPTGTQTATATNTTSPPPTTTSPPPTTTSPPPGECNDGVDNDGDGEVDGNDPGCSDGDNDESTGDPAETKSFNSTVTASHEGRRHKGQVASRKRCKKNRTVVVKEARKGRRPKNVGKDKTNKFGNWSVTDRNADGRFFAVVTRKVIQRNDGTTIICKKDRSPNYRA